MPKTKEPFQAPCVPCGGRCCCYVAIGIDSPRTIAGRENIRWFLLHENVAVYIDHNKDWYIEFKTPCGALNKSKRCTVYERRPKICSDYGNAHGDCEYYDTPYIEKFETLEHFEKWQEARKNRAARASASGSQARKKSAK